MAHPELARAGLEETNPVRRSGPQLTLNHDPSGADETGIQGFPFPRRLVVRSAQAGSTRSNIYAGDSARKIRMNPFYSEQAHAVRLFRVGSR